MSWMMRLFETFEKVRISSRGKELTPIYHAEQNAHINIVIDGDGNFRRAFVFEKPRSIILPVTEDSAGRTNAVCPHPLNDKLEYVAGDYCSFIKNNDKKKSSHYPAYEQQLQHWNQSQFGHEKIKAIYKYILKQTTASDLVSAGILSIDLDGQLLTKWEQNTNPPPLFKVSPKVNGAINQGAALVCWSVEDSDDPNSDSWEDETLQQSWVDYCSNLQTADRSLCYVTGKQAVAARNHPARLRHNGDKAKIISANDSSGYTYRGKFIEKEEACSISLEVTQKAHIALRWLINSQGHRNGEQVLVSWAVSCKPIPEIFSDAFAFTESDFDELIQSEIPDTNTSVDQRIDFGQSFAVKLNKKMAGYRANLSHSDNIIILALDSATPGRMAIVFYSEYAPEEFIDNLEAWHLDFSWMHIHQNSRSVCAPVPNAIMQAAYGNPISDVLKKNIQLRILPCISDRQQLPVDLLRLCVNRASNPHALERWEWERNISTTCALYRGFYQRHPDETKRRKYEMSLETENRSRDYLYGRLLAIAESIESKALSIAKERRMTTAERLMQRFAERPYSTWRTIELALKPYMQRLQSNKKPFLLVRMKDLDNVVNAFEPEAFISDKQLSGEFLLGYHCQRMTFSNPETQTNTVQENT